MVVSSITVLSGPTSIAKTECRVKFLPVWLLFTDFCSSATISQSQTHYLILGSQEHKAGWTNGRCSKGETKILALVKKMNISGFKIYTSYKEDFLKNQSYIPEFAVFIGPTS